MRSSPSSSRASSGYVSGVCGYRGWLDVLAPALARRFQPAFAYLMPDDHPYYDGDQQGLEAEGDRDRDVRVHRRDLFHISGACVFRAWVEPSFGASRCRSGDDPISASVPGRLLALAGLRLDQSALDRIARELYAVAHAEFLEDVLAVAVDGLDADEERIGDLLRRVRLGDELQHF
jgi:hypothetical protein